MACTQQLLIIIFEKWMPPVLTVVVGGLVGSLLIPSIQNRIMRKRQLAERRYDLIERTSVHFQAYITAWRRLRQISSFEQQRSLDDNERIRKNVFIEARTNARDDLFADFALRGFYFSKHSSRLIEEFMLWDGAQSAKTLEQLPDLCEWKKWEKRIMEALRCEQ